MTNIVQAHARAYDQIKRILGKDAKVGIIYATTPAEPMDEQEENIEAAKKANYAMNLWFFRAVIEGELDLSYGMGESAKVVKRSDLRDRVDWIGVNYYTRKVVKALDTPPGYEVVKNYGFACKPNSMSSAGRPTSDLGWELYPEGIMDALELLAKYGKPMAVTENGVADAVDKHRPWLLITTL